MQGSKGINGMDAKQALAFEVARAEAERMPKSPSWAEVNIGPDGLVRMDAPRVAWFGCAVMHQDTSCFPATQSAWGWAGDGRWFGVGAESEVK